MNKLIHCKDCDRTYTKYYIHNHNRSYKHVIKSGGVLPEDLKNNSLRFEKKPIVIDFD